MKVTCEIDNTRTLKKGMTITLRLNDVARLEALRHIANFMDKPIIAELNIDSEEQKDRLSRINPDQRRKTYALFKDIADYTGDNTEAIKINMKHLFKKAYGYDDFSLSDCDAQVAKDFITFLISWCFVNAVDLKEHPKDILNDIESYLYLCLKYKKCAVCGKPAEMQSWDTGRKIVLCQEHNTELVQGRSKFASKYHVEGIEFKE